MYRDDLEAALALNDELARRVRELEAAAAPTPPTPVDPVEVPCERREPPKGKGDAAAIARLVAADEHAIRQRQHDEQQRELRARESRIASNAARAVRVRVSERPGMRRVTIERPLITDGLRDCAAGIALVSINPGFVAMFVIGVILAAAGVPWGGAYLLVVPIWLTVLAVISVCYVWFRYPAWHVDTTDDGLFAVHAGNPQRPRLVGRRGELKVDLGSDDPAYLHRLELSHRSGADVEIEFLTDRDVRALRALL